MGQPSGRSADTPSHLEHRLIIGLDGSAHVGQSQPDVERTIEIEAQGYRLIRFWNHQVMNDFDEVTQAILDALNLI